VDNNPFGNKVVFFGVQTSALRTIFENSCDSWGVEDANAFCRLLLDAQEKLESRVKKLEDQLAVNSSNSSKPPSKDDFKLSKKRSLRKVSGKKPGGQPGHKGVGGQLKDDPDEIVRYLVEACPDCGRDLKSQPVDEIIRRQIEDLPPIKTIVTEHQVEIKTCPCCATTWQAGGCPAVYAFEYGSRIKAISVYLSAFQFIPAQRTKQMLSTLGVELSTGTLDNFRKRASQQLVGFVKQLRQSVIASRAAFFDETGMKVSGIGHWVHVAATSLFTLFLLHPKRGRQAHDEMDVLAHYRGILHRDDYHSYYNYPEATHSLCCAHLQRDLIFAKDRDQQGEWATPLIKLMIKIKEHAERSQTKTVCLSWQGRYRKQYRQLITQGLSKNPVKVKKNGSKRGRTAQTKTVNLLLRLRDKEDEVLRFMTHTDARYDNNQAERDLRMNKVRQKISGGFRSLTAGQEFMNIRSLVSTAIKQNADPVEELVKLFTPGNNDYMRLAGNPE
jgi:transposase